MTKKEFKEAMMRGLGRCILELDCAEDVERYREIVLWGCTRDLSYDAQCEGTRAWYVRELVRRFPEEKPFVDAVIRKLLPYRSKNGWVFSHYCELLGCFAREGNRQAFDTLCRKYEELYEILKARRRPRKNGTLPERDDFEILCIELIDAAAHPLNIYLKMAEDIGMLMSENPILESGSFDWLFTHCEQTYGEGRVRKMLAEKAKSSPAVKRYFYGELARNNEFREGRSRRPPAPWTTEEILKRFEEEEKREQEAGDSGWKFRSLGLRAHAWIRGTGNTEALSILAQRYLTEQNSLERAKLLYVFGPGCPFPLSPEPLIQDAGTGEEVLKDAAFYALDYVRHEKVCQLALELAGRNERTSEAISLLANHYQAEDREILVRLVKSIPVTYEDIEGWHGAYSTVLSLLETKGVKYAPRELLPYLYEHTLCSCCRGDILKEMGRRHMITEELLRECLYDSSDEIRSYARKLLKNRKRAKIKS